MSATFVKHQFGNVPFSTIKNYFDGLNISIISTSLSNDVFTITIDNTTSVSFRYYTAAAYDDFGYNIAENMYNPNTIPLTFITGFSDTFFYLCYYDNWSRGITVVYEKINGKRYFGGTGTGGFQPITSIRMRCVEDQGSVYFKNIISYSVDSGTLDYTQNSLFNPLNNIILVDPNTITCTDVTQNKIITFNGNRYFSLGPNTLIQLNN
jgi:hypothetical protein